MSVKAVQANYNPREVEGTFGREGVEYAETIMQVLNRSLIANQSGFQMTFNPANFAGHSYAHFAIEGLTSAQVRSIFAERVNELAHKSFKPELMPSDDTVRIRIEPLVESEN